MRPKRAQDRERGGRNRAARLAMKATTPDAIFIPHLRDTYSILPVIRQNQEVENRLRARDGEVTPGTHSSKCYGAPGEDLRLALLCKSISSRTALSGFLGSSLIGIRSASNLIKGTATICGALSDGLE